MNSLYLKLKNKQKLDQIRTKMKGKGEVVTVLAFWLDISCFIL